jgi:hypothetical protein
MTDEIVILQTADIHSNEKNPRVIRDAKFQQLVQSIKDFPDMLNKRPLICYTDNGNITVLGGNMRLKALLEIGVTEIPVIMADAWTDEQREMFIIKDNVSFGEWDWENLANHWDSDKVQDWGLEVRNFEGFTPFIEPQTSENLITSEQIEKRAKELADSMMSERNAFEAICPECGHEFKFTADGR